MVPKYYSRIVIGGMAGDSGKTLISCGLIASFISRGIKVSAFKKGPDYIDAAWLSLASGKPARNLDTFMMGFPAAKNSFLKNADENGINLIEGNRGLFDGVNSKGTHSTAELAKLLRSPVIIVQDISKVTRTAAASIAGCVTLGRELNIVGVILNRAGSERHAKIAKNAIEGETGVPVLGIIPKLPPKLILPDRYLGLITPEEFEMKSDFMLNIKNIIEYDVDVSSIIKKSINAPPIEINNENDDRKENLVSSFEIGGSNETRDKVSIGYFKDKAFSFYYPENLETLKNSGADLIPISAEDFMELDNLDALYIGGGFPELNLTELVSNKDLNEKVKTLAEEGLPIYAECGGLIYLAEAVIKKRNEFKLSGVLPIKIRMHERPQGHGYCEAVVDSANPFFEKGTKITGHEFHYSNIYKKAPGLRSSLSLSRGVGCFDQRDGIIYKNVFASYVHVHATATPEWAAGMINCARKYKCSKTSRLVGIN